MWSREVKSAYKDFQIPDCILTCMDDSLFHLLSSHLPHMGSELSISADPGTCLLAVLPPEEAQSLCNRVALMDHGKLEEVSTPSALIESLGAYAVDEASRWNKSHYFHTRQDTKSTLSGKSYEQLSS